MTNSTPRLPWQVRGPQRMPRNRLHVFRQLLLVFASVTLLGMALTPDFVPGETVHQRLRAALCALLVAAWWFGGYKRGRFPLWGLLPEAVLLCGFTRYVSDPPSSLTAYYIGVQFRALYGTRRDAWLLTFAFGLAFVGGIVSSPGGSRAVTSPLIIEIMALGFFTYLLHTLAEVLERDQRGAAELRESEQRFRAVAENLREALLITDRDDRIILANSRVRDILGYEPPEVIDRNATELLLPEDKRNVFRDRLLRRLGGETELYEAELVRKDGTRLHAEISAGPYKNAAGEIIGTLGAISDVTDRKQLEERLQQGMRLEVVGQLAGGVAHDFNNLLTVIKCHTELLDDEINRNQAARSSVDEIARSAQRGAELTQQLLAFSRRQMLQPRRVSLATVVQRALPRLQKIVGGLVTIDVVSDATEPVVIADLLQLEHVLAALAQNAAEAMPSGGRLTIETATVDLDKPFAADHALPHTQEIPRGSYAMLLVSDTGVGMDRGVQARIFEPFFTTKPVGEGSGLGLASMYGIVRQSGGFVDMESAPGAGTIFRIYLRLATNPPPNP